MATPQQVETVHRGSQNAVERKPTLAKNFTRTWLNRIRAVEREVWHDKGCRNLVLRIGAGPKGSKVFYWYGRANGKPTREKIGVWKSEILLDEARKKAQIISGAIAAGKPPSVTKAMRDEKTFGELFTYYMEYHSKPFKRSWLSDEQQYELRLKHWENWKLSQITREVVKQLHVTMSIPAPGGKRQLSDKRLIGGPIAANRLIELIARVFRVAEDDFGFKGPNPARRIKMFTEISRERYLSPDELWRLWPEIERCQRGNSRDGIMLALLTGARCGNVAAMRWDQIDWARKVLTVPANRSKNKSSMAVILSDEAIEILQRRKNNSRSEWVFPSTLSVSGHMESMERGLRAALRRAGINNTNMSDAENVRVHDLRRTFGSWQAINGTSELIIGKSLGHKTSKATRVYARLQLDPVREAVNSATSAMMAFRPKKAGQ